MNLRSKFCCDDIGRGYAVGRGKSSHHRNQHISVSADNLSPLVASVVSVILEVHTYWNPDKTSFTAVEINDC